MSAAGLHGTVTDLLRTRAGRTPDAVACHHRDPRSGRWVASTWRELDAEVRGVAARLRELGLGRGDRLAVLARTRREWMLTEFAGLRAGAVIVGIDPHVPVEQAAFVLRHSEARFLVADSAAHVEKLPADARAGLTTIVIDGAAGDFIPWRELADPAHRGADDAEGPTPDDDATLVYTAGTTGAPKAVGYTHRQLVVACESVAGVFSQIGEGDTTLCWLPMAHLFQRMLNFWAIARGTTIYFSEDPRAVLDVLGDVKPSFLASVPRFYEKLAQMIRSTGDPAAEARRLTGGNIKFMLTGSAPMAAWVGEYLASLGLLVLEAYGVTENTVPMAANRVGAYRFGSVGLPFPENELRFAEDGEIQVRGPGVFRGYYKEDERNEDVFTPDGFYRTGDIGRTDADGFLYLVGRKSEIIKTSTGRRVAPAGVEAVYGQSPLFDQVVVFGHGRKNLVALIALKRSAPEVAGGPNESAVRDLVRQELDRLSPALAAHEQVKEFAILPEPLSVDAGDLTPTLKLRRNRIAARYQSVLESLYQE